MATQPILQVEDEEADVFLLQHAFKRAGIQNPVSVVRDGQEAIDYLSGKGEFADRLKHPLPCLMLLDLKLPRIGGLEVLEWVRQQPNLAGLVVVVFSSSAMLSDIERAYALGASSYIQKPSSIENTNQVAQLLKGWWLGFNQFAPIYEARTAPPPPAGKDHPPAP
ncbi:MAG TPA: response regulator [Tepidisphaeraceae bacterium]|nr:response regulator [Tepidisphaeraceae bacterium]